MKNFKIRPAMMGAALVFIVCGIAGIVPVGFITAGISLLVVEVIFITIDIRKEQGRG